MRLYFQKITGKQFIEQFGSDCTCIIPDSQSIEEYKKINYGLFRADCKQDRSIQHHRKYFAILQFSIDNGIIEKITKKYHISDEVIESIYNMKKNDIEVILYILKWLYLPAETETTPDGKKLERVSSISFDQLDQLQFNDFYTRSIQELSETLEIETYILENN